MFRSALKMQDSSSQRISGMDYPVALLTVAVEKLANSVSGLYGGAEDAADDGRSIGYGMLVRQGQGGKLEDAGYAETAVFVLRDLAASGDYP